MNEFYLQKVLILKTHKKFSQGSQPETKEILKNSLFNTKYWYTIVLFLQWNEIILGTGEFSIRMELKVFVYETV